MPSLVGIFGFWVKVFMRPSLMGFRDFIEFYIVRISTARCRPWDKISLKNSRFVVLKFLQPCHSKLFCYYWWSNKLKLDWIWVGFWSFFSIKPTGCLNPGSMAEIPGQSLISLLCHTEKIPVLSALLLLCVLVKEFCCCGSLVSVVIFTSDEEGHCVLEYPCCVTSCKNQRRHGRGPRGNAPLLKFSLFFLVQKFSSTSTNLGWRSTFWGRLRAKLKFRAPITLTAQTGF